MCRGEEDSLCWQEELVEKWWEVIRLIEMTWFFLPQLMPRVRWKRARACVCVFYVSSTSSLWSCSHAYLHAWLVYVCGRCEGFPSVWNEVVCSQWAIPRGKIKEMDLKTWNGEAWPKLLHWQCDGVVFSQNTKQQQHQQHPRLQLQPHAQAPNFVSHTFLFSNVFFMRGRFKINTS